jgi:acetoin utilization deacetylase AcuC-like enzyme
MTLALITHPACRLHDMGIDHPEQPARLDAINDQLIASGLDMLLRHETAPAVTREQLERVHTPAYVQSIFEASPLEGRAWLDPDTRMSPESLDAALHAAGAVVYGVDLVMRGDVRHAFCMVRPPGHHATRDSSMGFCIFNNVAVGAAHALAVYGLQRVAIVDFDVHHGNGTEDIFRDDPRVLYCSTFQHPFYPYQGADSGNEHIINVPLPAGSNGVVFREAVERHWVPALEDFGPELILISAGFDAHVEDDMSALRLVEGDYQRVTQMLVEMAARCAHGRIVSVLEGGYALSALGRSVAAHLNALLD